MEQLHYFALSFVHGPATGSVYVGYPDQKVSVPRLNAAKKAVEMPHDAVLIGLGYMGYMSKSECQELV